MSHHNTTQRMESPPKDCDNYKQISFKDIDALYQALSSTYRSELEQHALDYVISHHTKPSLNPAQLAFKNLLMYGMIATNSQEVVDIEEFDNISSGIVDSERVFTLKRDNESVTLYPQKQPPQNDEPK